MTLPLIMTPGPTYIHADVRNAMAREITNPDLDLSFYEFYRETCESIKTLMKTENDVLILGGEGILGLEAACCSIIEPGDRILCIDNGIFGKGFGEFAAMYGAEVTYFTTDYRKAVDPKALRKFLEKDGAFKAATLVHCETPSAITNPVHELCPLLKEYGIMSIVDSVSAIGGEELFTDGWDMDIVLGGSQKCLSAPPGLTFLSISPYAWEKILGRSTAVAGFYCNLTHWKHWYEDKWFPYTQPANHINALNVAVRRLLGMGDWVSNHRRIGEGVRKSMMEAGLELFPLTGHSNTVTTVMVPEGLNYEDISRIMLEEHNIMIAGAFDFLKGKVLRIGHMGENCREDKVYATLKALDHVLAKLGFRAKGEMADAFSLNIK